MFIVTRRLFLRPAWPEDAAAVHAAIADWDIVKNLARVPWPYTMADAEAFCAERTPAPGTANLLIFTRDGRTPELAGGIAFSPLADDDCPDLGYWIAKQHQGRGYATEASRAMLALAFDGLRHAALRAGHFVDNPASGHVLRKLGFKPTGAVVHHRCRARGTTVPTIEYRLTRTARQGVSEALMAA